MACTLTLPQATACLILCFAGWLSECTASHPAQNNTPWSNVEYFHHRVYCVVCYTLQLAPTCKAQYSVDRHSITFECMMSGTKRDASDVEVSNQIYDSNPGVFFSLSLWSSKVLQYKTSTMPTCGCGS